jgi:hypothetical protein
VGQFVIGRTGRSLSYAATGHTSEAGCEGSNNPDDGDASTALHGPILRARRDTRMDRCLTY